MAVLATLAAVPMYSPAVEPRVGALRRQLRVPVTTGLRGRGYTTEGRKPSPWEANPPP